MGDLAGQVAGPRDVRIVFSDLDETFLATDKSLLPRNMAVLDLLAERGIPFVPCTGRPYQGIPAEVLAHPATRYAVSADGACVTDVATGAQLMWLPVGTERALALYERTRGLDVTFDVFADGRAYTERRFLEALTGYGIPAPQLALMRRIRTPMDEPTDVYARHLAPVERISMFWRAGDERTAEQVRAAVAADPTLRATRSSALGIEITDSRANKGVALRWLCDHLGIPVEASVAFGDSMNDMEMIRDAGCGVAVANGEPALREAADLVCPANDEGGVGTCLRQLLAIGG